MTTIAADCKTGVMCSDSFWFDGDECGVMRKVYRVRHELFGFAGDLDDAVRWRDLWRKSARADLSKIVGLTVLRLSTSGMHVWDSSNGWLQIQEPQFSIGTGGKAARAAMMAGASCHAAVGIAARIDARTGGPVRTYRL